MKHLTFTAFVNFLAEAGAALGTFILGLGRLSWRQLLMVCISLALLIAILPTALFLFLILLSVKVIVGFVFFSKRDKPEAPAALPAPSTGEQK